MMTGLPLTQRVTHLLREMLIFPEVSDALATVHAKAQFPNATAFAAPLGTDKALRPQFRQFFLTETQVLPKATAVVGRRGQSVVCVWIGHLLSQRGHQGAELPLSFLWIRVSALISWIVSLISVWI